MATSPFSFYYHQAAWTRAFSGNSSKVVFDTQGSVYKDFIAFDRLVVGYDGVVGPAGAPIDGQITIWANADTGTYQGAIHVMVEDQNNTYSVSGGTIAQNQYFHFALALDNAAGEMRLYINGALVSTTPFTGGLSLFNRLQRALMYRYLNFAVTDHWYKGKVDDFRIYGQVLTPQDITDVYDWGRQRLQFEQNVYVPPQAVSRGVSAGFMFESEDFMQIRGITYEHIPINMR